jgi:cyclic beta-1,2-glucan synthetase
MLQDAPISEGHRIDLTSRAPGMTISRLGRDDQPLRAEFLSLDQLTRHAHTLANWHHLAARPRNDLLLPRLHENAAVLGETYEFINTTVQEGQTIVPAAIWLLDNYYVIDTHIRMTRRHLPRRYSLELPQLIGGPADGYPRVYDIAMELISHADGLLDADNLKHFVAAYQTVTPLKLGELWAIPIMLRLALLENLRRISMRIAWQQTDRDAGRYWADQVLTAQERDPKQVIVVLAELIKSDQTISSSFVAEYIQRLQGRIAQSPVAVSWLDQWLVEHGQTSERVIHLNSQVQAADQVSIGNSITSLRSLGALDWKQFVEGQSFVDRILRSDPSDVYRRMSFASRDRYRHVIEKVAKRSPRSEIQVARVAVELAQEAQKNHPDSGDEYRSTRDFEPDHHLGYYLVDEGRDLLEKSVGYRRSIGNMLLRVVRRCRFACFVGTMTLIWIAMLAAVVAVGRGLGAITTPFPGNWELPFVLLGIYGLQFSVSIVNWLCNFLVKPHPVSQLDFSEEIPIECRTIVIVPTMLTSARGVASLLDQLEVRFLANRDQHLHFGLLTDFADAETETTPQDDQLVLLAKTGIERLNQKYSADRDDLFYLFHRPRVYNAQEEVWMGRERKRGKLSDFNSLLRGGRNSAFSVVEGNVQPLSSVRYVITLDTDTQLPRDSAHRLVGYMAHPLNRPRFDDKTGCVTRGYAILQPRVAVTIPEGTRSGYSRRFAGDQGIDPYTNQVSNVYQDVFGEGSFIGKGIYDLQAFESALHKRFPDNQILSHDLIESCFARSGVLSDLELFEGFPSRYLADASRRHRWVRGDWQLLWWLAPKVPTADGRVPNPLSWLSWWKLADNLRRSLMPGALLLALMAAWMIVPEHAVFWSVALVSLAYLPSIIGAIPGLFLVPSETPITLHLKVWGKDFLRQIIQETFSLAVLPYEAHWNLDAIGRTLYRVFYSHKKLLEWTTASDAERRATGGIADHYELMFASTVVSLALLAGLVLWAPFALPAALPLLALWLVGPLWAWHLSQPTDLRAVKLSPPQRTELRLIARKTWHYYETFATERDHWLAPDNYQEHPTGVIATRTSPTNIGMGLIANLAAWDFRFTTTTQVVHNVTRTLSTMDQMDQYRGHFYNWYDTRSLRTIEPRYVSSVDSGNLAGLLLTLKSGLEMIGQEPLIRADMFDGLADTLRVALRLASEPAQRTTTSSNAASNQPGTVATRREVVLRIERLMAECQARATSLSQVHRSLEHLSAAAADVVGMVSVNSDPRVTSWIRAFETQCREFDSELTRLVPWIGMPLPEHDSTADAPADSRERIDRLRGLIDGIDKGCTLNELPQRVAEIQKIMDVLVEEQNSRIIAERGHAIAMGDAGANVSGTTCFDWNRYSRLFESAAIEASSLGQSLQSLGLRCAKHAVMDFTFLYDPGRDLLSIGYNVSEQRRDASFYDLLASESRLASYVAISQGQLPKDHWFALGRMLTTQGGEPTLLSWSGSMFEYLMPSLIMPTYEGTLLDLAERGAVKRQIEYGVQQHVPWGVSESCYNVTDANLTYQYRAFGVPGLGLQRGLGQDLVIAPYACVMGAMIAPVEAYKNLERLERDGYFGDYGFYDAVDFTSSRLDSAKQPVPCRTYMAHHSGMSLLALDAVLFDQPMQKRFLADPILKAHDLLLQERIPHVLRPVEPHPAESLQEYEQAGQDNSGDAIRTFETANTASPEVQLLGDGKYHVMISNSGGGYSRWNDLAVTRWLPDHSQDQFGQFCYIREQSTGEFWSNTFQPTLRVPEKYHAVFSAGKAEFRRVDRNLVVHTTVGVSPEDDIEVRRVKFKNISRVTRSIDVTSYAEVIIAPQAADIAHRAFSNLFVTTELLPDRGAILCTRRPRSEHEKPPFLFHLMICEKLQKAVPRFETDRAKFIGRGRSLRDPVCMLRNRELSNSSGAVLDPIVSIRRALEIEAEESVHVDIITGIAATREIALAMIEKYQDHRLADRALELAWPHEQVAHRQFGASDADVKLFCRLAGQILYGGPLYRPSASLRTLNRRNQSHLWSYAISGDLPIVLVRVAEVSRLGFVRTVLQAHAYWRLRGVAVDLVIWNEDAGGYRQQLHDELMGLVSSSHDAALLDRPGGIFIRRSDQMPEEDRLLLESIATVVLSDVHGTLAEQVNRQVRPDIFATPFRPTRVRKAEVEREQPQPRRDLIFFNGLGGFTPDGKEYITLLNQGQVTPAPWSNVIANEFFGTIVTESGLGHTWFKNAHEYRLTPWHNDPVCDPVSEAMYIRDEETGKYFCPAPSPVRGTRPYVCRHGFGYTVWEHEETGLHTELATFIATDAPVKFMLLKVRNASGRKRSLSVTGYVEWVLGEQRFRTAPNVVTEIEPQTGAILARNYYNIDFNNCVAFFQSSEVNRSVTADRAEFMGRNGTLADPDAMRNARLSGKTGAGLDPCCAIQVTLELVDGEEREVMFMLGAADSTSDAVRSLQRFKRVGDVRRTLEAVWNFWSHVLGSVYVETPDQRLNILANGWLQYQTLSCRFWGRSGYYQSGGAFGFRDQLQDSLALLHSAGYLTRAHLLRCASRQFREGDVQHWWHPPTGRGVRTHFSDDYLWLPYVAAQYVQVSGDTGVLDEAAGFLTDRPVAADEEGFYGLPQIADESASLYEHCRRAITYGLRFGSHGLPLMGCGDWNDGMNKVGAEGKGESVWLAFFLYDVLLKFAPIARSRNDLEFARSCLDNAETIRTHIESNAWDGGWYRRAYFDNGQPLGSSENAECQIDSIPQSWSVISGAGNPDRMRQSMDAVYDRLVHRNTKIIQLFTPPFDRGSQEPGYIKGYVPGVRENGGQYTHAAIWTTMAFALLGESNRAWECFDLINPLNHSGNEADADIYKVEPYVIAADVYSVPPQEGRGGWTWYTGSSGWMYRLISDVLLGLRLEGGTRLTFRPCVPVGWKRYKINYRHGGTFYRIQFTIQSEPSHHVNRLVVDGVEQPDSVVNLVDDSVEHTVEVFLGAL